MLFVARTNNPRSWRRVGAVVLTLATIGLATVPAAAVPCRLVDRQPGGDRHALTAGGTLRHILDRYEAEQRIGLDPPCDGTRLTFDVGLQSGPASVLFELQLEMPGRDPVPLFSHQLSTRGWVPGRVELEPHPPGSALVFRRTLVEGTVHDLVRSGWGNPIVFPSDGPAQRPSIVLISLDTLRADRVGAATPALNALARGGVSYRTAYSASTWTVPSHAALFQGQHIIGRPANAAAYGSGPALAELLRNRGWLTAAFTGGGFLSSRLQVNRGFDTYYAYEPGAGGTERCDPARFDGAEVFGRAAEWLRRHAGTPVFLFVHTYDVHDRCPYLGPAPHRFIAWPELSPDRQRELLAYYDRLVADTDARVGALLRTLDELGLASTTIVAVTSDHGEAFSEHGQRGHGCDLAPYEELARVPLILRAPGVTTAGEVVTTPVSGVDLTPTLLRLAGLAVPPDMTGRLLPGLGLTGSRAAADPVYVHCGDRLAVRAGALKLITSRAGAPADELYDVEADPAERHNRREDDPRSLTRLRELAAAFWTRAAPETPAPLDVKQLDPATRERLRALGYGN